MLILFPANHYGKHEIKRLLGEIFIKIIVVPILTVGSYIVNIFF